MVNGNMIVEGIRMFEVDIQLLISGVVLMVYLNCAVLDPNKDVRL